MIHPFCYVTDFHMGVWTIGLLNLKWIKYYTIKTKVLCSIE